MGVPKFYRWISERYPCLSEVVKEFQIPEFDTLYLDMNGIVHVCSHPEDDNPHFRITEEKIFTDVSHYIEFLFRMIKPRRCFFMAIDGVAPRAKMNQQRGRRFRSAREAEELEKKAREKGEILPNEKRFDSNCITPGTPFMARLQEYLKYFVVQKISSDPLWNSVKVILSGHETPGEGEHKIMDYIRYQKSQPGYDANTRHCLYGLDADLMMLGLVSHEPHFCLLREEVRFGGRKDRNKRPATPEETTFHLLHLSLMREYLDFEFSSLKEPGKLSFDYDLERIIDDFVLMGFLVGNDFIPHLPHLHIHHDGLPLLWRTYMKVLPNIDGYLNDGGHLNLRRFEAYMKELAKYDVETFSEQFSDLKWLEGKIGKKDKTGSVSGENKKRRGGKASEQSGSNQFGPLVDLRDDDEISDLSKDPPIPKGLDLIDLTTRTESPDTDDGDTFDMEFRMHKANYYRTKMDYSDVTPEVLQEQARGYVLAIQWILLYYFEGVPSWGWFYPHHYAPYISDITGFADMKIELELGYPFLPFQQLMAVLPAASKEILPVPYQDLMINSNSPVVDFYPVNFSTDLNGKLQEWEAVVLIPFIDESRLLKAMEPINLVLTDEEKARNRHGPHRQFEYSAEPLGEYTSPQPELFPDISVNRARRTDIPMFEFRVAREMMFKGLPAGVRLDVYFPGFPTMKHIDHQAQLRKAGVKVFQMNSRGENMVVKINHKTEDMCIERVAADMLGLSSFVGWPHLFEAKVIEVSDGEVRYKLSEPPTASKRKSTEKPQIIHEKLSDGDSKIWSREAGFIKEQHLEKRGLDIGRTSILLKALPMMGRKYVCTNYGQVTLEKQWGTWTVNFALQACVKDIAVHDPSYTQFTSLEELYAPKTSVFMLGQPHYGCQGEVVDVDSKMDGRIRVSVTILQEPSLQMIRDRGQSLSMQYMPGFVLAQRIGISSHLLSRMTGSIFVARGSAATYCETDQKVNVGLNLKFNKRNEEVPGFTKKVENQWLYSNKTLDVVSKYLQRFPQLFDFISTQDKSAGFEFYYEEDIFSKDSKDNLKEVTEFLKTLSCFDVKPMKAGAEIVDELVIKEIEKEVDRIKAINKKKRKSVKMQVKPHLLFRPVFLHGSIIPDPGVTYQLFDRVVNIREGFSVPFGLRGSVVGIHRADKEMDTMYEVVFDADFLGGITLRCSPGRGYRCSINSLINMSHGERKENAKQNPVAANTWSSTRQGTVQTSSRGHNSGMSYAGASTVRTDRPTDSYTSLKNGLSNKQTTNQNSNNRNTGRGLDTSPGSSAPFVMPKTGPNRTYEKSEKMPNKQMGGTSEFADMWKELQGVTEAKSPSKKPSVSLSEAAQVLGGQYPGQYTQAGVPPLNTPKSEKDVLNRHSVETDRRQAKTNQTSHSQSGSMTKIDVQSLFGKASNSAAENNASEFAAMMSSLEISGAGKGFVGGTGSDVNSSSLFGTGTSDYMSALGVGDVPGNQTSPVSPSSPQPLPSKSYGKQLSVQELFEGAKQSAVTTTPQPVQTAHPAREGKISESQHLSQTTSAPGAATDKHKQPPARQDVSQPQHLLQQQQPPARQDVLQPQHRLQQQQPPSKQDISQPQHRLQQQQQPVHPLHGNPLVGLYPPGIPTPTVPPPTIPPPQGKRNPVMELLEVCNSVGMAPPKYDYDSPHKGQMQAIITLATGSKFHGSVCGTREAAAESAASMTLRQLGKMPFNMMMVGVPTPPGFPGSIWQPNLPFSPNSAFSPVLTKQPRFGVPFMPPGQHQFTQPPPNYFRAGQFHPNMPAGRTEEASGRIQDAGHHRGNPQQPHSFGHMTKSGQDQIPPPGPVSKEGEVKMASNPFVPLQVIQKQKSPQKPTRATPLKGDNPDKSAASGAVAESKPIAQPGVIKQIHTDSRESESSKPLSASRQSDSSVSVAQKEKVTPPEADSSSKKQPKRTRSRLAANFNFTQ